jgi:hypothetical protein
MPHPWPYRSQRLWVVLFILFYLCSVVQSTNFTQCLLDVREKYGNDTTAGGVDNNGFPVPASIATGLTYNLCVKECGTEPSDFDYSAFSEQFIAWLLPWMALLSQLPYDANNPRSNMMALFLAVGSPVLAAFSLLMTVHNGRWIKEELDANDGLTHRKQLAARVLNNLQQVPVVLRTAEPNTSANGTSLYPNHSARVDANCQFVLSRKEPVQT